MVVAIVLVLLVVGSVLFHFLSPWYFTPIASNWSAMDDTISITFWVTGFVFVAINLFMAYAVIRTVDARHVSDKNPFGMNPDDPNGQDDVLISSPELHLPVGRPVKALLRSIDVLHDFAVPQFRAKMDLVPGLVTYIWFTPTRTGKFDLLCNELCGTGHFVMRGSVVVEEEAAF